MTICTVCCAVAHLFVYSLKFSIIRYMWLWWKDVICGVAATRGRQRYVILLFIIKFILILWSCIIYTDLATFSLDLSTHKLINVVFRPSVRPSVDRVRSVSSTILAGSISYLHILSSNFRRCVACKVIGNILQFEFLAVSLNLWLWLCLIFTQDLIYRPKAIV